MSTLTKVFVVLLLVFSIGFSAMTVSMVARTTDWREAADKYREHARIADTNLRHAHAQSATVQATLRDELRAQQAELEQKDDELQAVRNETAQLRSELDKATAERSSSDALNRGLLGQLQAAEAARAEYRKQRDELESRNIDLARRNIDLNDRVNELTVQVDVLVEQRRQYEQQLNTLRAENEQLSQQARRASRGLALESPEGVAMSKVSALTPVPAKAIRGRVLEVSGNLLTVSVGSADGVRKDMVFVVHRDGQYVGDVRIDLVDPNQSAGRLVRSTLAPTPGDQVTDEVGLSSSRG